MHESKYVTDVTDPADPLILVPVSSDVPGGHRQSEQGDLVVATTIPAYARARVMGVPMAACTMKEMVETVEAWVDSGGTYTATGVNANVVNMSARNSEVRQMLEGNDLNYADGQSMVWAGGKLGLDVPQRAATTDMIYPLAAMAARRGFALYFLGATQEIVDLAAARLIRDYPGLKITTHHGYISDADNEQIVADIAASGAQIVLVGMGDPKQQQWVRDHRDAVSANVLLTCGGLFDWVSGTHPRPPQWMIGKGLEWLWRIWIEPRRLLRRYLVGNPEFVARFALTWIRRQRATAG